MKQFLLAILTITAFGLNPNMRVSAQGTLPASVVEIATSDTSFNTLVTALTRGDLSTDFVAVLSGAGPFTVFAPTNDAFADLLQELGVASLADIDATTLEAVLKMHVVSGKVMSSGLSEGMMAATLQGEEITFSLAGGAKITDLNERESNIIGVDFEAQNGVVHVIDKVILPDQRPSSVVDIATSNADFSILVEALTRSDLSFDFVGYLTSGGPVTVFAPTNDAFVALLSELGVSSLDDVETALLEKVLKLHIVSAEIKSTSINDYYLSKTIGGQYIKFNTTGGAMITDPLKRVSNIIAVDVLAQNGRVHVIDKVLLPDTRPNTVVDIATGNADFSILVEALTRADLAVDFVDVLRGDGPFTVFAPTNAAFAALLSELGVASLADIDATTLEAVLKMHVVSGRVMSGNLSEGLMAATLEGDKVTFSLQGGASVTDPNGRESNITAVDLDAQNGVVHVIDKVILPDQRPETVVDIVVNSDSHNTLEAAVVAAGLVQTLQGDDPFTVFAPTDAAFAALPAGTLDALLADPSGQLTDILLLHVAAGEAMSKDLSNGQKIETVFGENLLVTINSEGVFINDAQVKVADIEAQNGVVHVIDAVLLPNSKTVVDIVVESENHNTLEAAVIAANLAGTLSGDGPFTLFAPTDDAFAALPAGTLETLLADPSGQLTDILLHHVVAGEAMSSDLSDGQKIETVLGQNVKVTISEDGVFINNAQVTVADIEAVNGVVHVIDAVLLPTSKTVVDIVVESENHNTLEAAVIAADLAGTLSGEGPFTVFAPTDAAFAALPAGTLDALLADPSGQLTNILLYHVVAAKAMSEGLMDGQMITTALGQDLMVSITSEGVFINGAKVSVADIEGANGVVHVIDAVLQPKTVTEIVVDSENHNTLEAAVVAANLAGTLSGVGPFTLFAPTDAAFAALPTGTLDALLADPSGQLTDILLHHVVGGEAMSADLSDGQKIETVFGQHLTVTISSEGVFIDGAKVTVADVKALNGVVHVIDAVLLPTTKTVADIVVESADHTTLEAAVVAANLAGTLSGVGPFTVFAPTDAAFAALPAGTLDALLADPSGQLTDILLHHVVAGEAMSGDLSDGQKIETVYGQHLTVSITSEGVFINDAQVTVADIEAVNGFVHVIDAVLLPTTKTVVDVVVESDSHNTLEAAVLAANLAGTLSGDGPFTVFAPTDAAFAALPAGTLDALLADPSGQLTDILLHHVVAGKAMSSSLAEGQKIETLLGQNLMVSITSEGVFINEAQVSVADIEAANGVVHVIDAVLLPTTKTVVDIVVESENHNTLEAAVVAAGLAGTLSGDGPFTVFAPTDAAFAALPAGTLDALLADPSGQLTDILLHHVVAGKAMSAGLSDGQKIETVLGKDIRVRISSEGVFINDAQVTVTDIEAVNGVVHVIDAVLLPAEEVRLAENDMYGKILTDAFGYTLYLFTRDANGSSMCTGGCLANWPAFYAENMEFAEGLDPADFASIDRGGGLMQTTYKGWPLYYFAKDSLPGQVMGEGVIGKWFVAKPDYTIMLTDNQLTGLNAVNYKGDYTPGDEIIQYFTDDEGVTLYTWKNDKYQYNAFTKPDFSNNSVWPIYEESSIVVPSVLDAEDFKVIKIHGKDQLTYKGWPLYYFSQDMMMRGSNKGVSVPSPGIWPVPVSDMMMAPKFNTVVDIATGNAAFSILVEALTRGDLTVDFVNVLTGEGPFTVFAPTNDAFADLLSELGVASLADIDSATLEAVLKMHVVSGKVLSSDLSEGMMAPTLQGEEISFSLEGGATITDLNKRVSNITGVDIMADNGVVHVIDKVILPDMRPETVVNIATSSSDFSTLVEALTRGDLAVDFVGVLTGEGPFTVFAPTNDAFAALLTELGVSSLSEIDAATLEAVLKMHVVSGEVLSSDLSEGMMAATLQGGKIVFSLEGGASVSDENGRTSNITASDLLAKNGVVHVIDKVILPDLRPATVVDIATGDDAFSILVQALTREDLSFNFIRYLTGNGPITVFAPTNDAFVSLLNELGVASLDDLSAEVLEEVLKLHIVSGEIKASSVNNNYLARTIGGEYIRFSTMGGAKVIDPSGRESNITVTDLLAKNGRVHVIDQVLLPQLPPATVVDIVVESENHSTLEAAVVAAGLVETLQGAGPFTVFAPTDAAFAALPAGTLDALLADPSGQLTDILLYHVVAGKAMSSDLSDGQMIETVLGQNLKVTITEEGVFINDARVTVADIEAQNGVVHVIDAVLIPTSKTIVDIATSDMNFSSLVAALTRSDLTIDFVGTLSGAGPFTVFAPTNDAFADLLDELGVASLNDIPVETLEAVLMMHVVSGKVMSSNLSEGMMAPTLQGQEITFSLEGGAMITDPNGRMSKITAVDIEAVNGVVHVIDKVILPDLTATSVSELEEAEFSMYPNPTTEVLNIESAKPGQTLSIFDLAGKLMVQREIDSEKVQINVQNFVPGVYLVNLRGEKQSDTRKLIVR